MTYAVISKTDAAMLLRDRQAKIIFFHSATFWVCRDFWSYVITHLISHTVRGFILHAWLTSFSSSFYMITWTHRISFQNFISFHRFRVAVIKRFNNLTLRQTGRDWNRQWQEFSVCVQSMVILQAWFYNIANLVQSSGTKETLSLLDTLFAMHTWLKLHRHPIESPSTPISNFTRPSAGKGKVVPEACAH